MLVYLDEQPVECAVSPTATIGQLIEEVRGRFASPQRLLVGIHADGEDIADEDYAETLGDPANLFDRYDFVTGEPRAMVHEALPICDGLLNTAEGQRREIIECLTQGRTADAFAVLGKCVAAWSEVHRALSSAMGFLRIDASGLSVCGRPLPESMADIKAPLTQMRAALEARDFVLVSDVLQYELEPVIQNWRNVIGALRESMEASKSKLPI